MEYVYVLVKVNKIGKSVAYVESLLYYKKPAVKEEEYELLITARNVFVFGIENRQWSWNKDIIIKPRL